MSTESIKQALKRAFQLGQNYWSWADSEYSSHWKKADAAKAEFDKLVEDTLLTTKPAQEFVCSTGLCHYKAQRQWVGLGQDDIDKLKHMIDWTATWSYGKFACEIERILKEKNA
jgi:hypothetical protein